MKKDYHMSRLYLTIFTICTFIGFTGFTDETGSVQKPFAFSELGQKATEKMDPDSLGIKAVGNGAEIVCKLQALEASVTPSCISIRSTSATKGGTFSMNVVGLGRELGRDGSPNRPSYIGALPDVYRIGVNSETALPSEAKVSVSENCAQIIRPELVEEYTVSGDGIRQDFIVFKKPEGTGELSLFIGLNGATAELSGSGLKIRLNETGREFAYSKLLVTDATGKELPAGFKVISPAEFLVNVDDSGATYPIRIDPTISDPGWLSMNTELPGTNGEVKAIAYKDGNLYIGGNFTFANNVSANHIAKWDGSNWSALGTGINGTVYALGFDSTGKLYAGGEFDVAGGVTANRIAKWNGSSWSPLDTGMNGKVYALSLDSSDILYAGGEFTTAAGITVNRIAKWDGFSWSSLSTGMSSLVSTLACDSSDNLYAGGSFTTAGGVTVNYISKWDGFSWNTLGTGMERAVFTLALDTAGNLYAGGEFTSAGGVANTTHIAKWDGAEWNSLGTGMGLDNHVYALAFDSSGNLYAGGNLRSAGGVSANRIAKWDGSNWSALGTGMNGAVHALAFDSSGKLYAGGDFTTAGGTAIENIAKWNGSDWNPLGGSNGINGLVYASIFDSSGNLYVGGYFTSIGGVANTSYIARWNGTAWISLGTGLNGDVYALAFDSSGNLYAGGYFTNAGGVSVNNIAKWNGSSWSALGNGTDDNGVSSLAFDSSGNLYAGGWFTSAGGGVANTAYIAKWDGSNWSALGTGMENAVFALESDSVGNLYAGGYFHTAGGVPANKIAKWDGKAWSPLGTGIDGDGEVNALACDTAGNIYVGGNFFTAGGIANTAYIAKWNGKAWSPLGTGMDSFVWSLSLDSSGKLYAGGDFTTAGAQPVNKIAKWNGSTWSSLGTGMDGFVRTLVFDSFGNLYVGGKFTTAGNKFSPYLALWGKLFQLVGTVSGTAMDDVTMTAISGAVSRTVKTKPDGTYSFTGLKNGSYTVTPFKAGYSFTPKSRNVTINAVNVTGMNFSIFIPSLGNRIPVTGLSGIADSLKFYRITVPTGIALLEVKTYGGTGAVALEVNTSGMDKWVDNGSTNEVIRIANPAAGDYVIGIIGTKQFSRVTLLAGYYASAPKPPATVSATKGTYAEAVLVKWKASPGATLYEIYQAAGTPGSSAVPARPGSPIGETSDLSYVDRSVVLGTTYYYWIVAKTGVLSSVPSAYAIGKSSIKPAAPASVTASAGIYFDKIRISWPKVAGATSYLVYRGTLQNSGDASQIAEVEYVSYNTTYTYDDMGLSNIAGTEPKPDAAYYYWVKAKNDNGPSDAFSKMATGFIGKKAPAGFKASAGIYFDQIKLTWTAVAGATEYIVNKDGTDITSGWTSTLYYDSVVGDSSPHTYYVRARYSSNGSDYDSASTASSVGYAKTTVPKLPAPVLKSAILIGGDSGGGLSTGTFGNVMLTWGEVPSATSYNVYRQVINSGIWDLIGNTTAPALVYTDDDMLLSPGTTYLYAVTACNPAVPESAMSATKKVYVGNSSPQPVDGTPTTGLSGEKGSFQFFDVTVPTGCTRLVVTLTNVSGSCDIYAKIASYPTTALYNAKGALIAGTIADKRLTVTNPPAGTWYILLAGSGTNGFNTVSADAILTANCYSAANIILTQVPADGQTTPFTAAFKGRLLDESGTGIPGFNLAVRDPLTGLATWITTKTDAKGYFAYSAAIPGTGEFTYDFFITSIPDNTTAIASRTVTTAKSPVESNGYFDLAGYVRGTLVPLGTSSPDDLAGMQDYMNLRRGFTETPSDMAVPADISYEANWVDGSIGVAAAGTDPEITGKLDVGLYLLLYGTEGAAVGNGLSATPGLTASPLLIHVDPDQLSNVLDNIGPSGTGMVDSTFVSTLSTGTGLLAITVIANPDEADPGDYNVSLMAQEQLELLATLAGEKAGSTKVVNASVGTYAPAQEYNVTLPSGRILTVVIGQYTK
ncbi:MAG TPA: hypothetical protein DET40_12040 [Lentisphaeria bacterium]|nr:MAG: hypothetical protein A2X45_07595 [Lentisphaerae bacterium GWF2_50_93]HCE44270.1 hypothetical protein [Lentisphaeria bacterium]